MNGGGAGRMGGEGGKVGKGGEQRIIIMGGEGGKVGKGGGDGSCLHIFYITNAITKFVLPITNFEHW